MLAAPVASQTAAAAAPAAAPAAPAAAESRLSTLGNLCCLRSLSIVVDSVAAVVVSVAVVLFRRGVDAARPHLYTMRKQNALSENDDQVK